MNQGKLLVLNSDLEGDLHTNNLSAEQLERLSRLIGECAEVIHVAGKIINHGYKSEHPVTGESNDDALERELGHLQFWVNQMIAHKDVYAPGIDESMQDKAEDVGQYLHYTKIK